MSEIAWIVAEIIVGIALLGILSAVITAVMVPWLARVGTPRPARAEEILAERYARGELTRDQYLHMRQDLGRPADAGAELRASGRPA